MCLLCFLWFLFNLIRHEDFVHPFPELGAPLFQFPNTAAVLAAAEVVGGADDEHDTADQGEKISEREDDRKILKNVRGNEISRQMHHGGETADDGADHHLQPAV